MAHAALISEPSGGCLLLKARNVLSLALARCCCLFTKVRLALFSTSASASAQRLLFALVIGTRFGRNLGNAEQTERLARKLHNRVERVVAVDDQQRSVAATKSAKERSKSNLKAALLLARSFWAKRRSHVGFTRRR